MGTYVPECRREVRELLQDCALAGVSEETWFGAGTCNDGRNTCQKIEEVLSITLRETFDKWNKNYKFFMEGSKAAELIHKEKGSCKGERQGKQNPELIRPGYYINITFHICS